MTEELGPGQGAVKPDYGMVPGWIELRRNVLRPRLVSVAGIRTQVK